MQSLNVIQRNRGEVFTFCMLHHYTSCWNNASRSVTWNLERMSGQKEEKNETKVAEMSQKLFRDQKATVICVNLKNRIYLLFFCKGRLKRNVRLLYECLWGKIVDTKALANAAAVGRGRTNRENVCRSKRKDLTDHTSLGGSGLWPQLSVASDKDWNLFIMHLLTWSSMRWGGKCPRCERWDLVRQDMRNSWRELG